MVFYAAYIVVGLGMAATGMVPATAVISNWFVKWRGTAVGIMSAGIGAGGFVLAPLIGAYIIPKFGWRTAFVALALVTWMLIPLALIVLKTKPEDMGLYPDGRQEPEPVAEDKAPGTVSHGLTLKMALATLSFWLIAISFLSHAFSEVGLLQSQVPYLEDVGFPLAKASTVFGAVGLFSFIGKFGFGWLCDRIQAKYACTIGLGMQVVGLFILLSVRPTSPMAFLYLFAVIMGLGVGSWLPAMSMLVSTNFGLIAYGTLFGIITFSQSIGASTGPLMAGYIFDIMGNYDRAFIIFLISYAVAIPTVLASRRPKSL
jgi:MFS family permease